MCVVLQYLNMAHSGVDDAEGALICHALSHCRGWLEVNFAGMFVTRMCCAH